MSYRETGRPDLPWIVPILICGLIFVVAYIIGRSNTQGLDQQEQVIASGYDSLEVAAVRQDWRAMDVAVEQIARYEPLNEMALKTAVGTHVVSYGDELHMLRKYAAGQVPVSEYTDYTLDSIQEGIERHKEVIGMRGLDADSLFDAIYGHADIDSLLILSEVSYARGLLQQYRKDGICGKRNDQLGYFLDVPPTRWSSEVWSTRFPGWRSASQQENQKNLRTVVRAWYEAIGSSLQEGLDIHKKCGWVWEEFN